MTSDNVARLFYRPDPVRWTSLVLLDWLILVAAFGVARAINTLPAYWVASLVVGNRMHAISIMGHDGGHYTASRNRRLNDILTVTLTFWPLFTSLDAYRKFHFSHHRLVGTDKDPELVHKHQWAYPEFEIPVTPVLFVAYIVRDLMGFGAIDVLRMAKLVKPTHRSQLVGPLLLHAMVWGTCVALKQYWIPALWCFSLGSSYWAFFRLRIWLEHVGTPSTHRMELSPWLRMIIAPHYADHHYEHHRWPAIPCWHLAKARTCDRTLPVLSLTQLIHSYRAAVVLSNNHHGYA